MLAVLEAQPIGGFLGGQEGDAVMGAFHHDLLELLFDIFRKGLEGDDVVNDHQSIAKPGLCQALIQRFAHGCAGKALFADADLLFQHDQ